MFFVCIDIMTCCCSRHLPCAGRHSVRVGEYDADTDPDCSTGFCARPPQDIPVDHVVVHPSYERATFRHDVALLVLKAPIAFSLGAQPICISQNVAGVVGQRARLVGWGITAGQAGESIPLA